MAYEKKDNYPSRRRPGVYGSGSAIQLGLNTDELEHFSLGSWQEFNLDSSKIEKVTGWTPHTMLSDGLDKSIEMYKNIL